MNKVSQNDTFVLAGNLGGGGGPEMTVAEIHPFSAQPDEPDERTETRPETSVIFRP